MKLHKLTVLIVSLLALFAILIPSADAHDGPYATNATSGNDSGSATQHAWWSTNGCTVVPDSVPGVFHFNHACDHHDGCYGNHWESRWGCDVRFWRNMESSCTHNWAWWNPARLLCRGVRDTYFAGVRALGYVAYNGWSISGPSGW